MLGIAVNKTDGRIYIADAEKHCIIVASPTLTLLQTFGTKGSEEGQLNKPRGIAIDSTGRVFVVDANNDRVCIFSHDGKYISSLEGELDRPSAIAIDNHDFVYVTEMVNGRVFVYDKDGSFVHKFGRCGSKEGEYSGPQGIAIDDNGDIIISDTYTCTTTGCALYEKITVTYSFIACTCTTLSNLIFFNYLFLLLQHV